MEYSVTSDRLKFLYLTKLTNSQKYLFLIIFFTQLQPKLSIYNLKTYPQYNLELEMSKTFQVLLAISIVAQIIFILVIGAPQFQTYFLIVLTILTIILLYLTYRHFKITRPQRLCQIRTTNEYNFMADKIQRLQVGKLLQSSGQVIQNILKKKQQNHENKRQENEEDSFIQELQEKQNIIFT